MRWAFWRDCRGRLTEGFSLLLGPQLAQLRSLSPYPGGARWPPRPRPLPGPSRARVPEHGVAGISRVSRRLWRADAPGLRAGLAAVRQLVPAAPATPVRGPPRGYRVLRRDLEAAAVPGLLLFAAFEPSPRLYPYAVEEELLDHSLAGHVRRPRLDYESHATCLDRTICGRTSCPGPVARPPGSGPSPRSARSWTGPIALVRDLVAGRACMS